MWKRKLFVTVLIGAGLIGAMAFDEYQTVQNAKANLLMTTIGVPYCAPQQIRPQFKTFFRLAMAQQEGANKVTKTEIGPFSNAIPDAESIAHADANPALADDLGTMHYPITTANQQAQQFFDQGLRLAYAFNHLEAVRS